MPKKDGSGFEFQGYCIDLLDEIQKLVNFDYEIYEAPDLKFGNMDENGAWNGMIKELMEKVRDRPSYRSTLTLPNLTLPTLRLPNSTSLNH